jgi:ribosomal protein S25
MLVLKISSKFLIFLVSRIIRYDNKCTSSIYIVHVARQEKATKYQPSSECNLEISIATNVLAHLSSEFVKRHFSRIYIYTWMRMQIQIYLFVIFESASAFT